MKNLFLLISIFIICNNATAQKLLNTKWHRLVVGGTNGFFTKTHIISDSVNIENQFGSGDVFDDSPMEIKVETVFTTANDERVVTKYGDSLYTIIVFKNINESFANVCYYTNTFKTIDEAKQYQPTEESYLKWFTKIGYDNEMAKPVMPAMKKKDAIEFANYFADKAKKLKEGFSKISGVEKTKMQLASAMILAAVPGKFAESKGYNSYKSIPVIEKGMKAFSKDADVLKVIKKRKNKFISMKSFLVALVLLLSASTYAQKQYNIGFETVFVPGTVVSTIKLVDYNNKQIGTRITHTSFDNKKAVFTSITTDNDGPYIITLQVITKDALKGLVQDFEVKKAYINPEEEKTIPKSYWDVSVGFRKPNKDVVEVGNTTHYKKEDGTAIINNYLGTSYTVPFATKAAAETFVTRLKNFLK